jgi:hypothetical protein
MRKHGYRDNADAYNQGRSSSGPGGQSRLETPAVGETGSADTPTGTNRHQRDPNKSLPIGARSVDQEPNGHTPVTISGVGRTSHRRDPDRDCRLATGAGTGPTLPCEANASRADRSTSRRENQGVTLYQILVNGRPWGDPQTSMTAAELLGIRELAPRFIDWTVVPVSSGGER